MPLQQRRSVLALLAGLPLPLAAAAAGGDGDDECLRNRAVLASAGDAGGGERFGNAQRGAWRDGFTRPALAVELNSNYGEPSEGFLRGPRCYGEAFVRPYVHEVLHFWQTLSAGFITNLALQEWGLLQDFRASGVTTSHAALLTSFTQAPAGAPFSPWALSEALCRYWDIHILGPERLLRERGQAVAAPGQEGRPYAASQFDRLMGLEDSYASPYRWAVERWGSVASVLLFPLVGYFALQTRKPVEVFLRVVQDLQPAVQQLGGSIHVNWRKVYPEVRRQCNYASVQATGNTLTPGWDVLSRSTLSTSPVWSPYRHYLAAAAHTLGGRDGLDRVFALPGDPECRGLLASAFLPAVTLFHDGRWTGASALAKAPAPAGSGASGEPLTPPSPAETADAAERELADYRAMRQAVTMKSYDVGGAAAVPAPTAAPQPMKERR